MDVRTRTRKLVPVVGSMAAAATAIGGLAAVAQVAPVSAEPSGPAVALGFAGLASAGLFEPCDAYFGFGKDEGVLGVVEFDVADVNGADGVGHAVPDDVQVVLVLENEGGDVLECEPFEVTEEQWDEGFEGEIPPPPYPGPGHYAYPSVNLEPFIGDDEDGDDDFGLVVQAGFRVARIPGAHTLVSPEGVKDLRVIHLNPDDLFSGEIIDQRVLDAIAAGVSPEAADAFEAAIFCGDDYEEEDALLLAGFNFLLGLLGEGPLPEVSCFEVDLMHALASLHLSALETADYVENIRLSVPEPTTPTPMPTPPAAPRAAQAVTAVPQFTG